MVRSAPLLRVFRVIPSLSADWRDHFLTGSLPNSAFHQSVEQFPHPPSPAGFGNWARLCVASFLPPPSPFETADKKQEATNAIQAMQEMDILVLYTGKLHRKIAVIDDEILWEGSLNILSQNDSCEIMRRIKSEELVRQTVKFLNLDKFF